MGWRCMDWFYAWPRVNVSEKTNSAARSNPEVRYDSARKITRESRGWKGLRFSHLPRTEARGQIPGCECAATVRNTRKGTKCWLLERKEKLPRTSSGPVGGNGPYCCHGAFAMTRAI